MLPVFGTNVLKSICLKQDKSGQNPDLVHFSDICICFFIHYHKDTGIELDFPLIADKISKFSLHY